MIRKYADSDGIELICNYEPVKKKSIYFSCSLVVKVGSLNDPQSKLGLAHYVEHMNMNFHKYNMVKNFEPYKCMAYTNYYQTVYTMETTERDFENALKALLNIVAGKYLLIDKVDNVRNDILKELKRGSVKKNEVLTDFLFQNTKYQERIPIGKCNDIKGITYEDIYQSFLQWYVPSNMEIQINCNDGQQIVERILERLNFYLVEKNFKNQYLKQHVQENFQFSGDSLINIYAGRDKQKEVGIYYHFSYKLLLKTFGYNESYFKSMTDIISDVLAIYLKAEVNEKSSVEFVDFSQDIIILIIKVGLEDDEMVGQTMPNMFDGMREWLSQQFNYLMKQYKEAAENYCNVMERNEMVYKMNLHFTFQRPLLDILQEQEIVLNIIRTINVESFISLLEKLLKNNQRKVVIFNERNTYEGK